MAKSKAKAKAADVTPVEATDQAAVAVAAAPKPKRARSTSSGDGAGTARTGKQLVIVESPAKAKTINKYLGDDYVVRASMGHVRDLPSSGMGVDLKTFVPEYVMIEDPVPSNCRITERDEPYEDEEWSWSWARTVILDDRISFFDRKIKGGSTVEYSYVMRAESNGKSSALPTRVGNMYDPEDYASTKEIGLQVEKR